MLDYRLSRRDFIGVTWSVFAYTWFAADLLTTRSALAHVTRTRGLRTAAWKVLSREQATDIDAIAAQIMPSDETAGAREAGVVHFIDQALASWAHAQRRSLVDGLDDLNRRARERWPETGSVADLPDDRLIALLLTVEQKPFFQTMRFLTLVGMFALPTYGGNAGKVGWHLIGFDDRYRWQPPFGNYDDQRPHE